VKLRRFCKAAIALLSLLLLACGGASSGSANGGGTSAGNVEPEAAPLDVSRNIERITNWFDQQQRDNGLLESAENNNFVSLYDNALAALVFLSRGEVTKAEAVFDFFNSRIDAELLVGNGGFSQFRNREGTPNDDHRWMGDNAWLLIALNNYKSVTGRDTYDRLAQEIEIWLRSLQDSDGGLFGGYDANDQLIPKITEGMIDAYNAVPGYDEFHADLLRFLEEERWDAADRNLVAWPGNPQFLYALDLHSWSFSLFEGYAVSALTSADRFLTTQRASANGAEVRGYCFDEDRDAVWLEGTGQMAVAFHVAGMSKEAALYMNELEKVILDSELHEDSAGLPYATNRGTSYGGTALWQGADLDIVVSSSAWYLFAATGFNPFAVGRSKSAPTADEFWVDPR